MKRNEKVSSLYMFFGVLFTMCLLVSNIIASKQVTVGNWVLTAGVICFPISYILSDVVAEVYGFIAARRVIWYAFIMNVLMVVIFQLAILWPAPAWYGNSEGFAATLGNTPRMLGASLAAYLVGSWMNAAVLSKMKVMTAGRGFGVRAIVSTIVGELMDSCIFIPLAFIGVVELSAIGQMILLQVAFKTLYEVVMLPVTSRVVKKVKAIEGLDTYDYDVKRSML